MPFRREHRRLSSDTTTEKDLAKVPGGTPEDGQEKQPLAPWRALFFFTTKENLPILAGAVLCSLIAGASAPINSFLLGKIMGGFTDYATGTLEAGQFMAEEKKYVIYIVALAGGSWVFSSLSMMGWLAFGELQAKSARDRLFKGMLEKDIEWYDMRKNGVGALLPRLQAQIRDLQLADAQPLGVLVTEVSNVILSLIQAFVYSWDLTLVTLSTTPLILIIMVLLGNGMQKHISRQEAKLNEAQKHSNNAFSAIETVKCFNGQETELMKYTTSTYQAALEYFRMVNLAALQLAAAVLLSVSMFVQGFYYGGILVGKGSKRTEDIITTFMSAIGAFQALQIILPQMLFLEKGRAAGATLRAVMAEVHRAPSEISKKGRHVPQKCHGDIDVRHCTFSYPSRADQHALDDVSMFIKGGEFTFLIGKSGSGKSTISQLLMRFYSTSAGLITIDGIMLEDLDVEWLRSNITLVEQHSLLFNESVFRNIALGRKDFENATQEEVMDAVQFALLQLMVSDMPDGLETIVGFKGGAMSGGQRQRMALARAKIRDTPILILDESTSALDHISRGLMMEAIRRWRKGRTTIVITHDIAQIEDKDYLYLLEHGRVVQEGYRSHLANQPDTPFQDFLPPAQRLVSPTGIDGLVELEGSGSISRRGSADIKTGYSLVPSQSDAIERHLTAAEQKRATFLDGIVHDASPLAGIRAVGRGGGPSASAWMRMTTLKPPSPPNANRLSKWFGQDTQRPTSTDSTSANDMAQKLQNLVNETGRAAVEARRAAVKLDRSRSTTTRPHPTRRGTKALEQVESDTILSSQRSKQTLVQIFKTIWPVLDWPTRLVLVLGFIGAAIHGAGTPVFSFVLSKLIQTYAVPGGDKQKALVYSLSILGIACVDATGTYMFRAFLEWVAQCWVDNIRAQALERILDQPREFFDKEENSVSVLVDNLDRNAEEMRNLLGRFAALSFVVFLMTLMSLAWSMASSWKLTLISTAVIPYMWFTTKAYAVISGRWETLSNDAAEQASVIFTETFSNIRTVRGLTLESYFSGKYTKATNNSLSIGFRRALYAGFFYGISDSAGNLATALIIYVGARLASSGTPINSVITVFTMLIFATQQIGGILQYIPQIGNAQDTASRLLRLANLPLTSHERLGRARVNTIGTVAFTNLNFSYPSRPNQPILRDFDLILQPGKTIAIVGGSGSGKSTLANLLLNLYPSPAPLGTDLTIASRPLKTIHTPTLRSLIIPVSQNPTIFPATIAQNITYGLDPATISPFDLDTAASRTGIKSFIDSLPNGYQTLIGEGGTGLSGGQAQRLCIARAIIRKPAVLILDEATSALDVESAEQIRRTVGELVRDGEGKMMVVIITHAREMMEIAEQVVVLDQGRVVEVGGFEELQGRRKGVLRKLLRGGEWEGDDDEDGDAEVVRRPVRREVFRPDLQDMDWKGKERARD